MKTLYTGIAVGGPMDGKTIEGRYPGGILFVDRPSNQAWLYDYVAEEEKFYLRPEKFDSAWSTYSTERRIEILHMQEEAAPRKLDYDKRLAAAESTNTEVRALPEGVDA